MDLIFHLTYLFNDFFLTTLIKCFSTLLWFGSINKTESSLHWARHIPAQLTLCTGVCRSMPLRLPSWHRPASKQILARSIIPEAGMANSRGDPLPAQLHLVNNSGDTTHRCTSAVLSITRIVSYCQDWVATLHWLVSLQMSRHTSQSGRRSLFFTLALVLSQLPFNRSINSW